MNNTYLNEASSLDRNKMTENLLKFDQKIFTAIVNRYQCIVIRYKHNLCKM